MSGIFDTAVCRKAIEMAMPSITAAMQDGTFKRSDLCIVVVNPSIVPGSMKRPAFMRRGILYEHCIGKKSKWKNDYSMFAKKKAYESWLHRMSGRMIQACFPHLLRKGDILYPGGVCFNEVVVASSGVEDYNDEHASICVASGIYTRCIAKRLKLNPDDCAFVK